jgi:hypothetical protein
MPQKRRDEQWLDEIDRPMLHDERKNSLHRMVGQHMARHCISSNTTISICLVLVESVLGNMSTCLFTICTGVGLCGWIYRSEIAGGVIETHSSVLEFYFRCGECRSHSRR